VTATAISARINFARDTSAQSANGLFVLFQERLSRPFVSLYQPMEKKMNRYLLAAALIAVVASPAIADEVGVRAGPVGAGVSVGESHDRDRDRDRTVVKEREPSEGKTVIKKEDENGNREKTVIHRDN
jgi:hypothetical protein